MGETWNMVAGIVTECQLPYSLLSRSFEREVRIRKRLEEVERFEVVGLGLRDLTRLWKSVEKPKRVDRIDRRTSHSSWATCIRGERETAGGEFSHPLIQSGDAEN
jgi:hypothetical protein